MLNLYEDGMYIKKPGSVTAADFQPLPDKILTRTGLPFTLDWVYRWLAFLPSCL